ncbi:hypothetical protein [Nocardioides sp. Leaf374]|uniref:hypothetical protein n=1 Tax=Nocardioides sp. Leaf374 TaxID=2876560 RepID=UPI001E4F8EDF|nr:hypothetical protein [Nocardioides sp. Leaf374]
MSAAATLHDLDPFELPEWLGEDDVTWAAESGVLSGHRVTGVLSGRAAGSGPLPCDLLAVDEAHPRPVAADDVRSRAHLAWRHGQVLLVQPADGPEEDRLTLAVPGRSFSADLVLDALGRLAKAVGGSPEHYSVLLRIGVGPLP